VRLEIKSRALSGVITKDVMPNTIIIIKELHVFFSILHIKNQTNSHT